MVLKTLILKLLASRACHFKALYGHFPQVIPPRILGPLFWNAQYYI